MVLSEVLIKEVEGWGQLYAGLASRLEHVGCCSRASSSQDGLFKGLVFTAVTPTLSWSLGPKWCMMTSGAMPLLALSYNIFEVTVGCWGVGLTGSRLSYLMCTH